MVNGIYFLNYIILDYGKSRPWTFRNGCDDHISSCSLALRGCRKDERAEWTSIPEKRALPTAASMQQQAYKVYVQGLA
jgi:hypothetical protein